ncbi:MAG: hypothetical protein NC212_06315 [Staphylococcus sp.]|nr:hypothetical protein [Staphylococcus sp.]
MKSICVVMALMLNACHHHKSPTADTASTITLTLRIPAGDYQDYMSVAGRGSRGDDAASLRCIVDVFPSQTLSRLTRSVSNPAMLADGSCKATLKLPEGKYDLRIWVDHSRGPAADNHYDTSDLQSVSVIAGSYRGSDDSKEAAYGLVSAISLDGGEARECNVYLQRPHAKYRLIANDVAAYNRLHLDDPAKYPDVAALEFELRYEYYLPSAFDVTSGRPNDALAGIAYTSTATVADDFPPAEAVVVAHDMVFSPVTDSFLSLTLIVSDDGGRQLASFPGLRVDYRRGCLTTVTGNFLTAALSGSGVTVNTEWNDDIVIRF